MTPPRSYAHVQRCVVTQVPPPITVVKDHVMFPRGFEGEGCTGERTVRRPRFENSGCVYGHARRVLRGVLRVGELITVDGSRCTDRRVDMR